MINPHQKLGLCLISLLTAGLAINTLFPPSSIVVIIDTSYCPREKWQQVSQLYKQLYHRDRRRQIKIESVVLFNSLGKETLVLPPSPRAIAKLPTFGLASQELNGILPLEEIQTEILSCSP